MANLGDIYRADKSLMEEGVWKEVEGGIQLKVASWGNRAFQDFLDPYRKRAKVEGKEVLERATEEGVARFILLDWKNVEDEGKALPNTIENKMLVLGKYPQFMSIVVSLSVEWETFNREAAEQEAKNSESSPSGGTNTSAAKKESN